MLILFITRKKRNEVGGLSRFSFELTNRFPKSKYVLTTSQPKSFLNIPWRKIDLIHLTDATLLPLGVLIKSIIHKPLTVTAHGLDLCFSPSWYQLMLKIHSPKAHAVIVDSHPVKKLLKNLPLRINKIFVVNPGITIEHLKPSAFRLPNTENNIKLLTVGNLVPRKGHVWFIKNVFLRLPNDFVYFIIGDGPEKLSILKIIEQNRLKSRVFVLGKLNDKQLGAALKQSDIYVCPNQKCKNNFEGFGIAAGEAALSGLPVIASAVDGLPEIIDNGKNGILVKPEAKSFIQAINRLKNKSSRQKIGQNAKVYTRKNYSWDKTINSYVKIFQEVIDKNLKSR